MFAGRVMMKLAPALVALASLVGAASATAQAPNVLVVMSDDQRYGSVSKMPWLSAQDDFTEFTHAFANNPLCCPSRATFQSGLYSHHNLVEDNQSGHLLDTSYSIGTVFDQAGYNTGLFGKYLNHFPFGRGPSWQPEGYDRFVAFENGAGYYNYTLLVDGNRHHHGEQPSDYSTDVIADHLDGFIEDSTEPFFALYSPYGSHAPFTPAERHEHVYDDEPVALPPNFNEVGAGTHRFYRARPRAEGKRTRDVIRDQYETLLSEDEAMARFFATLDAQGELDNTIVVFTTDNGYSLGSHRWFAKKCLFDECARLPLQIRVPWLDTGGATDALVSNVDLPTTLADLAGLQLAGDGRSFAPVVAGESDAHRDSLLLRSVRKSGRGPDPPTAWGLRTATHKLIEYRNGEVDLFDLAEDPYELRDLAEDKDHTGLRRSLSRQLDEARREAPAAPPR